MTQVPEKKNATPGKTPPGTTASSNLKAVPPAGNSNGGRPPTNTSTTTTSSSTTQAGNPRPAKPTPVGAPMGNLFSSLNCVNGGEGGKVIKFPTTWSFIYIFLPDFYS